MKKQKFITVCPKCNSTDISVDFSNKATFAYGLPPKYICNNCDHRSEVFPEIPEEKTEQYKKHKKHITKEPQIDATPGYFALRLEFLIFFGLVGIVLALLGYYSESFFTLILGIIIIVFIIIMYRRIKRNRSTIS